MNAPLERPTRRATVVFFAEDIACLERRYGRGWTEQVRLLVHQNCVEYRQHKLTIEEIMRESDGN